jgi:hypothetical protein
MLLNHLPIAFSADTFRGLRTPYQDREQFESLRLKLAKTHFVLRHGDEVFLFPFDAATPTEGAESEFSVTSDFNVANALARHALLRSFFLHNRKLSGVRPVKFVHDRKNLITGPAALIFAIYPEYSFDIRPLAHEEGKFSSGVLVNFNARLLIMPTAKELVAKGLELQGLYVIGEGERESLYVPPMFSRKLQGRVDRVQGDTAYLTDSRRESIPLSEAHVEPNRRNFERVGRAVLGTSYDAFQRQLLPQLYQVAAAERQLDRIRKLVDSLQDLQGDLPCCAGLSVRLEGNLTEVTQGIGVGQSRRLPSPHCSLRPGGSITVPWPVDPKLALNGPFDSDGFLKKKPRVAVLFPANQRGHVEAFAAQLRDGIQGSPSFPMGMVRKYRLQGLDFELVPVEPGGEKAQAYRHAAIVASGKNIDAALVVLTREDKLLVGQANPYYTTKAALMSQGVPVQAVMLETIFDRGIAYSLNNISLAMYAKLGGIPWLLSVQQRLVHEIVVGIGSAQIGFDRLSERERLVGITTVFSGDGNYLLGNATADAPADEYGAVLLQSLRSTLDELQRRFGWRKGDQLRIIFHQSFKRYRDVEAAAVADLVGELSDFEVEYAFVQVSSDHDWKLFDPSSEGARYRSDSVKGVCVPERGQVVPLGPRAALVTLTGPNQLKTNLQGCPSPMLVSIHPRSTFDSLDYIAKQVHDLTFMSWRTFMPSTQPVSISYPNMVVELLGNLRQIPNFNPDILVTKLRESRWFL